MLVKKKDDHLRYIMEFPLKMRIEMKTSQGPGECVTADISVKNMDEYVIITKLVKGLDDLMGADEYINIE